MSRQGARQALTPFADRVKEAQAASGLTNEALADAIGVKPRIVQRWKAGTVMPSMENLARLARALDRPVSWFFEEAAA